MKIERDICGFTSRVWRKAGREHWDGGRGGGLVRLSWPNHPRGVLTLEALSASFSGPAQHPRRVLEHPKCLREGMAHKDGSRAEKTGGNWTI